MTMYELPPDAESRLQAALDRHTSGGLECGCQLTVYLRGKPAVDLVSGYTAPDRRKPVTHETLFPVFSAGKGVMATAFLRLLAAGKARLDDLVCRWWPEFTGQGKESLQIWQILCHRAGLYLLPGVKAAEELADWDLMCRRLEAAPCRHGGMKMRYHGITFAWLVGELARRIDGRPFSEIVRDEVLNPLNISREFRFGVSEEEEPRTAALDNSHDSSDHWCGNFIAIPAIRRGFIPSANGFATARAIAKHYAALLDSGETRLLSPEWIELATRPRRAPDDPINPETPWANFGLGYALCGSDPSDPGQRFGHGGAAGAEGYADKERQLAIGFTKNAPLQTHPDHPVRREIADILGISPIRW